MIGVASRNANRAASLCERPTMSPPPIVAPAEAATEAAQDPHPVAPEEAEQDDRRREVGRDEKREEIGVVLVDVPAQEARQDHAVAEARDGEQLGDALEQAEDHGLPVRDQARERDRVRYAPPPTASRRWRTTRRRGTRARRGRTRCRASRGGARSGARSPGARTEATRRAGPTTRARDGSAAFRRRTPAPEGRG